MADTDVERQKAELLRVSCTLSARKRFIFDREITRRLAGHLDQIDEVEFWGIVERALREVRPHVSRGSVR
jgi:hypothetical protein